MKTSHGFTVLELMVALLVAGVLALVAAPAYQGMVQASQVRSSAADLIAALNIARAQAVNLRSDVSITAIGDDWSNGWVIQYPAGAATQDEQFLPAAGIAVEETGSQSSIAFNRHGLTVEAEFEVCRDRTGESGRRIAISRFGRLTNEVIACN